MPRPAPRRRRSIVRMLLMALCACTFVACAVMLVRYFSEISASQSASERLEAVYEQAMAQPDAALPTSTAAPNATPTPAPSVSSVLAGASSVVEQTVQPTATPIWPETYPQNRALLILPAFHKLRAQNSDIVAWLSIEGVVTEPVLQRDNTYYLTHNADGERNVTGALFLDEGCRLIDVPSNMVIYGHNMRTGAMFGSLMKYKTDGAAFYKRHAYITMNTLYEEGQYVIFAVAEVDVRYDQRYYLPYWVSAHFDNVAEFEQYIARLKSLSSLRCDVDVVPGDRLVTLSTCTGDDDTRLIVVGRRVREGEDTRELNMAVMLTGDR